MLHRWKHHPPCSFSLLRCALMMQGTYLPINAREVVLSFLAYIQKHTLNDTGSIYQSVFIRCNDDDDDDDDDDDGKISSFQVLIRPNNTDTVEY